MLNQANRGYEKNVICCIFKTVYYRVYNSMGTTHGENRISKLDNGDKYKYCFHNAAVPCRLMPWSC